MSRAKMEPIFRFWPFHRSGLKEFTKLTGVPNPSSIDFLTPQAYIAAHEQAIK
jgi:hypothetical protein